MSKQCDNKSVGIIIHGVKGFVVILRANYPVAYAMVAGHLDGDNFKDAAKKESREEAGITINTLELKHSEKFPNSCKRGGGGWHEWQFFEATNWHGELKAGSDAKKAFWKTPDELKKLELRTLQFAKKYNVPVDDVARLTPLVVEDPEWQENPGLEPVWVVALEKIGIL